MRIILMGPPGSGKSVISRKIAEKYGFPVISMEEVAEELSAMAGREDEEGRLARDAIAMGRVSDEVCNLVLKRVLSRDELAGGYVLLGYPKDAAQAEVLHTAMRQAGRPIDLVLMIDIDRDELMERRVGRIDCDSCGAQYNLYVNPPMVEGVCDLCGGRLTRRPRGYEENISNQLREYDVAVQPILDYFDKQGILRYVDGNGTEEELWLNVQQAIDSTAPAEVEVPRAPAKPVARKPVKKRPLKKKAEEKKAETAKKPAVKKKAEAPKKTTAKKAAARKATTKKVAAKKAVVKKAATKKAVKKKAAPKKAVKKAAAKKAAAKKKAVATKATKKKVAKKVAKKVVKKTAVKKAAAKKVAKKKVASKAAKKVAKKKVVKKVAARKTAVKKKAVKKTAKKKAAKKRSARR